jgi:hypothetical protein
MEYNTDVAWKDHFPIHKYLQIVHSSVAFDPCVPKSRDALADAVLVAREEIQGTVTESCYLTRLKFLVGVHAEATVLRLYIPGFLGKMSRVR